MTEQKYIEDEQEEVIEQPSKLAHPSEDNLEESRAETTIQTESLLESLSENQEPPKEQPVMKRAADFLLQNKENPDNHQYSQQERDDNRRNWQRFVEPPNQERDYHNFPNYFFAGFWIRSFAYVIDLMCIGLITSILLDSLLGFVGLTASSGNLTPYGGLSLGIYLAYFILLTKLTNGQTIGKLIFGIQVVCFKEEKLSWGTVLVREGACRFILKSGFFLLGYLPAAFTPNKQHLGDFFSDTSVVTLNSIKAYEGAKF